MSEMKRDVVVEWSNSRSRNWSICQLPIPALPVIETKKKLPTPCSLLLSCIPHSDPYQSYSPSLRCLDPVFRLSSMEKLPAEASVPRGHSWRMVFHFGKESTQEET